MLQARDKSGKKKTCTEVRDIKFISKQLHQFFVFTFLSVQFKFSVHFIHSCLLCCLIAFPSHPFTYNFFLFLVICFKLPITRTFFKFRTVWVIGSRLSRLQSWKSKPIYLITSSPHIQCWTKLVLYVYNDIFLDLTCVSWERGISNSSPVVQAHYEYKKALFS